MNSFTGNFQQRFKPAPMLPHVLTQAPLPPIKLWRAPSMFSTPVGNTARMYSYVIRMSLVCSRVSSVYHSYVLVFHPYVTRMYSHVIRMSLVCTRMSSVCHSYVVLPWTDFDTSYILNKMSQLYDCYSSNNVPTIFYGNNQFNIYLTEDIYLKQKWNTASLKK